MNTEENFPRGGEVVELTKDFLWCGLKRGDRVKFMGPAYNRKHPLAVAKLDDISVRFAVSPSDIQRIEMGRAR